VPELEVTAGADERSPALLTVKRRPQSWAAALFEGTGWLVMLVLADVVALACALAAARLGASPDAVSDRSEVLLWIFPVAVFAVFGLRGLYRDQLTSATLDELARVVGGTALAAMVIIALGALVDPDGSSVGLVARGWVFASFYVAGLRLLLGFARRELRAGRRIGTPTLIVGAGRVGAAVERRLEDQPQIGLRPIGYLDVDPISDTEVDGRRLPVLGAPTDVAEVAERTGAKHVILAFVAERDSVLIPIVRECERRRLDVSLVPRLFESMSDRMRLEHLGGLPVLGLRAVYPKGWQFAVKHLFDRVVAATLIVLLLPLMLLAALAIKLSSPGPVLFRQPRIGRDGWAFDMLKFRSMRIPTAAEAPFLVPEGLAPGGVEGEDRRTPVGRVLRKLSIDELPQLLNVLKGDMSMIGPRPERPEFVELFDRRIDRYGDRHRVKSGMTGWAQVHGLRGRTSLSDRLEWDNYYIQNWSLWLDCKILLMTLTAIFREPE
jgi:exopolysaccharide biosynthesis polyprenyl glycosylphosphotransferase